MNIVKEHVLSYHDSDIFDIIFVKFKGDKSERLITCQNKWVKTFNITTQKLECTINNDCGNYCLETFRGPKNVHDYLCISDERGRIQVFQWRKKKFKFVKNVTVCKDESIQRFVVFKGIHLVAVVSGIGKIMFCGNFLSKKKGKIDVVYKHNKTFLNSNVIVSKKDENRILFGAGSRLMSIDLYESKRKKFEERHSEDIYVVDSYLVNVKGMKNRKDERIVCSSFDKSVSIWEGDGNLIRKIKVPEIIRSLFYVSNKIVLCGGLNGNIFSLINCTIEKTIRSHSGCIRSFCCIARTGKSDNPDSIKFATCSTDKKVMTYKLDGISDIQVGEDHSFNDFQYIDSSSANDNINSMEKKEPSVRRNERSRFEEMNRNEMIMKIERLEGANSQLLKENKFLKSKVTMLEEEMKVYKNSS